MTLKELKERAIAEFGDDFERATHETVERFVTLIHAELSLQIKRGEFIVVDESSNSYLDVLRQFFRKTLDMHPEDAAVLLWLTAFECLFSTIAD